MKADEYAEKMLNDGKYVEHTKAFAKSRWDGMNKPSWERFYQAMKSILWSIFKILFMYWLFSQKFLPTQGFEKTTIFLMVIGIVLLINVSRKLG